MAIITFLKPHEKYPTFVAKTFKLVDNVPVKVNDYKLGKTFSFETREVSDIHELFLALKKPPENSILIKGEPGEELEGLVSRKKTNFPEGESHIVSLDIDGWSVPESEDWDMTNSSSTHYVINNLLKNQGFEFLANTDYIFLLTSGQWTTDRLNCHLYFFLDEPIHITKMRSWCTALANVRKHKVFDPATQRSVQPDYIQRRKCIGFEDRIPENARISLCSNRYDELSRSTLLKEIAKAQDALGWQDSGAKNGQEPIGHNWLDSLSLCGMAGRGINEPAHRAAAQLVQEVGRNRATQDLFEYAQKLHSVAWENININDPYSTGERDQSKDIETYTISRFQQYIQSACSQRFGDDVDNLTELVKSAIEQAKEGEVAGLFDRPVLAAWGQLKRSHIGVHAQLKSIFKKSLRGQVSIADFEKAVGKGPDNETETSEGDWTGDSVDENQYIDRVLDSFDWIEDHHGNMWCGFQSRGHNRERNYKIMQVDTPLVNVLYLRGIEQSGGTVSDRFGTKAFRLLQGHEAVYGGTQKSRFKVENVGMRVAPIGGAYSESLETWINIGLQPDGLAKTICVNEKEVTLHSSADAPVRWQDSDTAAPIRIATEKDIETRFGGSVPLKIWTMSRLFDFFNVNEMEQPVFLGILLSILSGRGTSPLMEFIGPPSSGKSVAADLFIDLVDPVKGSIESGIGKTDFGSFNASDFIKIIHGRYLTIFDNVSKLDTRWQDMLCQAATGISKDQRVMYVGTYVKIFAKRPIIITSLASVVTRPDLATRKETIRFDGKKFNIRPHEVSSQWKKDKPYLFMGLVYLLRDALQAFDSNQIVTGLDARRVWYTIADRLFYDTDVEADLAKEERQVRSAVDMFMNSDFSMALTLWLQSKEKEGIFEIDDLLMHTLQDFKDFVQQQQGTTVTLHLQGGDELQWKVTPFDLRLPNTPKGFTFQLNKNYHIIRSISGWDVNGTSRRTSKGITKKFEKVRISLDTFDDIL